MSATSKATILKKRQGVAARLWIARTNRIWVKRTFGKQVQGGGQ